MTIESSHGKARPTLVRADDLRPPEAAANPSEARAAHGHFAAGNRTGIAARFKATLKKSLGGKAHVGELAIITSDAMRVFGHVLRSLPSDAPPVRVLVTLHARHVALHGYYTAQAEHAGLATEQGLALLAVADRQSQRAERVLVTALDVARVCAEAAAKRSGGGYAALRARVMGEGK